MKSPKKGSSNNTAGAAVSNMQQKKIDDLKVKVSATKKILKQANKELSESKDEVENLKKRISDLVAEVKRLRDDARPFDRDDQEHLEQHRRLKATVERLRTENDELQRSAEKAIAILRNPSVI